MPVHFMRADVTVTSIVKLLGPYLLQHPARPRTGVSQQLPLRAASRPSSGFAADSSTDQILGGGAEADQIMTVCARASPNTATLLIAVLAMLAPPTS